MSKGIVPRRASTGRWAVSSMLLVVMALFPWGVRAVDAAVDPTQTRSQQTAFQSNQDGEAHRIAVAAAFLLVLGIGGLVTVRYGRKRIPLSFRAVDVNGGIRLLSARRVTPRLTIVKVLLDDQKTVVIADNGEHLLLLSERVHATPDDTNTHAR